MGRCSLSCTRFVIRANKLRLGHNDLTTFTPLNQELNAIQLVFPIEMNFLGRSVLLFDLPFVSFLVSFALTLCLSICQAHTHTQTVPASCVSPYSVLVLVSLFSHVAWILARGSPSRFRYNFYFNAPLSLLLPFPSPSRNQFSSPFQA